MTLADYQALVDQLVRAQADTVTSADRDQAISLAVLRYSADCPRELVEDVAWAADGYVGPLPASWATGSRLLGAEFPIGEQPVSSIDVTVYLTPTTTELMAASALSAGDAVRVTFTAPHELADAPQAVNTIPDAHSEAVANYAAFVLFKQIAAIYSSERETPINADRADTESRAKNYALRAKDARAAYFAGIGKADPMADKSGGAAAAAGGSPAASVSAWEGRTRAPFTRDTLAL